MRYAHTNIVARDWRRLADFYIRVFQCTPKPPQRQLAGAWLDRATGLTEARLEGVHLLLPGYGEDGPTLEIFTYANAASGDAAVANRVGLTHIAFEVEDVSATLSHALAEGAIALGHITQRVIEGVGDLTLVYFRDPEGNIIEIQSWR